MADGAAAVRQRPGQRRLRLPAPIQDPYARMLAKVRVARASPHAERVGECWLFEGARDQNGHGNVRVRRRRPDGSMYWTCDKAHRISHVHHFGPIGPGLVVRHACDVANCVRPEHVKDTGTQAQNVMDMIMRGRARSRYGPYPYGGPPHGEDAIDPDCPF